MKPPTTAEQPPQSLTLSLRISEVLRKRLEDIRQFTAKRTGGIVSTSEIAKQLLESAREDRLEVVDLLARPTASLLTIRRKGESGQPLSRAEWTLLAYFAQQGAEAYAKTTLSRESFLTILKAFQAVYELRVGKSDKDDYYLGNLPEQCRPEGHKVSDPVTPDLVRKTVAETLRCVGNPAMQCIALHGARNLYVLLEDEKLSGVARLNEALLPYWRVLWRVAARGHYLERKEPVRDKESEVPESVYRPRIPSVTEGEFTLSFVRGSGNQFDYLISFPEPRRVMYPMGHYPMIVEFRAMLAGLAKIEPPRAWDGEHFFGYIAELKGGNEFWFRSQRTGVSFGFTKEEWRVLQELFRKAWEHPELKRAWEGLSLEYGEL
jgi:hypothetical protein